MSILKLKPSCKDYLWGGHRLAEEYGVEYDGDILAEAWELSCHPDGPSYITMENMPERHWKNSLKQKEKRFLVHTVEDSVIFRF